MAFDAGAIVGRIELDATKAQRTVSNFASTTSAAMTRTATVTRDRLQSIERHATAAGLALSAFGAAALLGIKKLISAGAQVERYAAQFKVLYGSTEAAHERLEELIEFAAKTPFDLPGVIEADRMMAAFGLNLGGGVKMLRLFGDAAAGTGLPLEQITRAMAKAREGMYDLAEMGILLPRTRLRELGIEFSKTGEIMNRADLFPAAIKLLARFSGMMAEMSETAEGKLSNLRDAMFQTSAKIGTTLLPMAKMLLDVVTPIIEVVGKWTDQHPKLTEKLAKTAVVVASVSAAAGTLLLAMRALSPAIGILIGAITALIAALKAQRTAYIATTAAAYSYATTLGRTAGAGLAGAIANVTAAARAAILPLTAITAAIAGATIALDRWLRKREEARMPEWARPEEIEKLRRALGPTAITRPGVPPTVLPGVGVPEEVRALTLEQARRLRQALADLSKGLQVAAEDTELLVHTFGNVPRKGVEFETAVDALDKRLAQLRKTTKAATKEVAKTAAEELAELLEAIEKATKGVGDTAAKGGKKRAEAHKRTLEEIVGSELEVADLLYETGRITIDQLIAAYKRQAERFGENARFRMELEVRTQQLQQQGIEAQEEAARKSWEQVSRYIAEHASLIEDLQDEYKYLWTWADIDAREFIADLERASARQEQLRDVAGQWFEIEKKAVDEAIKRRQMLLEWGREYSRLTRTAIDFVNRVAAQTEIYFADTAAGLRAQYQMYIDIGAQLPLLWRNVFTMMAAATREHLEQMKSGILTIGQIAEEVFRRLGDVLANFFQRALQGTATLRDAWNSILNLVSQVIASVIAAGLTEWLARELKMTVESPGMQAAAAMNQAAAGMMETAATTNAGAGGLMQGAATTTAAASSFMELASTQTTTAAFQMGAAAIGMDIAATKMLAAAAQMATVSLLPALPSLQFGGIVTRPTLAVLGEAGPEEVRPIGGPTPTGGGDTFYVYAVDAESVQGLLMRHGPAVADGLRVAARYNRSSTRPPWR